MNVRTATSLLAVTLLPQVWSFKLNDSTGRPHGAEEWQHRSAVALLFISADCPISNRYAPTINQLAADFGAKNTAFYGIQSDPDITPDEARKHAEDFGFHFPVLLDPAQVLASRYGVSVTPTAVVVSPAGEMVYRGRIDDRSVDLGKWRDVAGSQDLRDAIAATLANRKIAGPSHEAIGCFLPPKRSK
jgi:peroxiredoxin